MCNDILEACSYSQLNMNTPVWNISALGSTILVHVPNEYKHYQLYDIYDISGRSPREVNFFGKVYVDKHHPWLQIPTSILNLRSGKHTYRFNFLDLITNTYHTLFISYIAQDDNPETPYIYMGNRGNTNSEDNTWKDGTYADDFYENLRNEVEQTYGYDPLIFGETASNYCSMCALSSCENCPYKEG